MAPNDPRCLEGSAHFNRGDSFAAHETWEDLWRDTAGPEATFFKGLIQAAVALYHLERGNRRGADRLFVSGRNYVLAHGSPFLGLDSAAFWRDMESFFAGRAGTVPVPTIRVAAHRPESVP